MFQIQYDNDTPIIFIDARYLDNGKQTSAGIGVFFYENSKHNISESLVGKHLTNEELHLKAAIRGLEESKRLSINRITVATTSQYVVECAKVLIPYYKRNRWLKSNGQPPANIRTLKRLYNAIDNMIVVYWKLMKKSQKVPGIIMADKLALTAALIQQK